MSTNLYFQMNKWTTIDIEVHLSADDVTFIEGCTKEQYNNNSNNLKINNIIDNHVRMLLLVLISYNGISYHVHFLAVLR